MKLLIFIVLICVCLPLTSQQQSPCPDIFEYVNEGGSVYGKITLNIPTQDISSLVTMANFTIATLIRNNNNYVGRLEPIGAERIQRRQSNGPVVYRVHFPVTSPLPRITSITANGDLKCYGPGDSAGPGQYVTTINLSHTLFFASRGQNTFYQVSPQQGNNFNSFNFGNTNEQNNQVNTQIVHEYDQNTGTVIKKVYTTTIVNRTNPVITSNFYPIDENFGNVQPSKPFNINYYPVVDKNFENGQSGENQNPQMYPNQVSMPTRRPSQRPKPARPYRPPTTTPPPVYEEDPDPPIRPHKATTRPPPPSETSSQVQCGIVAGGNDRQALVFKGQAYSRGELPWLVAIYKVKAGTLKFTCSGTLITDRHVVTAAHCVHQKTSYTYMKELVVKVGVFDLDDWSDDTIVTRNLESINVHEDYNATFLANDISVFTFDKSVTFTNNIRPACLWKGSNDQSRVVGASGVVAGWGMSERGEAGHGEPTMVRIPIVSTSMCRASKPAFHQLTSATTLCAGDRNGAGPCSGDSGGGLYILDNGRWRLRGVVSLSLRGETGDAVCNLNDYIVFTDAAKYLDWIKQIVQRTIL